MTKIKKVLFVLLSLSCISSLFAHGKSDIEEISVENLNSWQEQFDLENKKPGKYNIMITASDLGGNTRVEGPHNLWLDPKSDLPITGITNPVEQMRVVGNLNIVGTCIDDDGVSKVELVLDEGTENETTVIADGKEFWSYYLDTTKLEEGPHTVKVTGYDINNEPVKGNPAKVTWQLDRKLPLTEITDRSMGLLVSGNVKFDGVVSDGNGIKELGYSIDGGKHFAPVKINAGKQFCTFSVSVDTKRFADGPSVLWFKAKDMAGSIGYYSFLYFIDNTKPDVQIISPKEDEIMNGKFSIAGFAKDTIGVTNLTWTFGNQSGEFELVPGNPYWCLDVDTIGNTGKSVKFAVKATDRAGNIVEVARNIPLNQENDKPVVNAVEPKADQIFGGYDQVVVRGLATDDDAVKSVKIVVDNMEPVIQETRGSYCYEPLFPFGMDAGTHKVTVTAIDVNGIEGNPVTTQFVSLGLPASFSNANLVTGGKAVELENGMEVHPEAGSAFEITAQSGLGLKSVRTVLSWGKDQFVEDVQEFAKNSPNSYKVSLPIKNDTAKGVTKITVTATDKADRVTKYSTFLYVTNTSVVKAEEPVVVFDDSRISEDGIIVNNPEFPASGYLLGEKAAKVEIVPATPFAKAELDGNQIKLVAGSAEGISDEVVVRVTTSKGRTVDSRKLKFKADTKFPEITFDNDSGNKAVDGLEKAVTLSGKVSCKTGVSSVKYRVIPVKTDIKGGVISSVKVEKSEDFNSLKTAAGGKFSIDIGSDTFTPGIYVVEVVAESAGGNQTAKAAAISTIPAVAEVNGKMPVAKAPQIVWVDAFDVYGIGVYQGELDKVIQSFTRKEMAEGANALSMNVEYEGPKGAVQVQGKYTASKAATLDANFAKIGEKDYLSGTPVVLEYGSKSGTSVYIYIDSSVAVSSVNYEISGAAVPGGDQTQKGSAKITKPAAETPNRWIAEIPLANLPVRVNNITATVKAGTETKEIKGSVIVVRDSSTPQDDSTKVYTLAAADTTYNEVDNNYALTNASEYFYYANVNLPLRAELVSKTPGLEIKTSGHEISLSAKTPGLYSGVSVRVTDRFGDVYESEKLNFIADSTAPVIVLQTPKLHDWVGKTVRLTGTVADPLGIRSAEFSLDGGMSWTRMNIGGAKATNGTGITFSENVNISGFEDGLIGIDIRAVDNAGLESQIHTACYKDTTAPTVEVVEPLSVDIVNGETLLVFKASDNGYLNKGEYVAPPSNGKRGSRTAVDLSTLTAVYVGTTEMPIDDAMSFVFTDEAGNNSSVEAWDFNIDNESDLPVSEIHVPEDMQVITRDFTISGVVYDDDGDTTMFYKIDNQPYQQLPEMGTSFAIDVPLSAMTDNEHTVTVYAVDINGVKGPETKKTFRISLEEPKGAVELPTIDTHVKENVTISGWASDKNGIQKVQISLDNGNSYNDAVGTENWSYSVDTRAIPGGTQVVFLKITDKYGIDALYSSLINIDNDAPELNLELPMDDSSTTGPLFFSGYTFDNVGITELYVTIRGLDKNTTPEVRKIPIDRVIGETLDISKLANGFYNVELTGKDKAGNVTNVSRNIHLDKARPPATVDILYPLNGEHKNGVFTVYGQSEGESDIAELNLYVDGKFVENTKITDCGFFKFDMSPDKITEGSHTYYVETVLANGVRVKSKAQTITYSATGPWITIDNFTYGDFATNRPYIKGQAGYSVSEEELVYAKTKECPPEVKAATAAKKVSKIEVSFDNGKTFTELSTNEKWKYRVENQDITEGYHFFLVRATMLNGETAITRTIVQIDNTEPTIRLISPDNGGRYNQKLDVSGLSNDDVRLEDVKVTLRKGDKASYEVPSFIQGLYLDFHFWGATLYEVGAGLTFFDDVVKVQLVFGQFTQDQRDAASRILGQSTTSMRYGGDCILGVKILANVASIPFSYFFGHDFEWLYADFAIGAQFTRFNETNSGKAQILSAPLIQMEFPKIKIHDVKMFSSFAIYTEGSLWFIPTDVSSTVDIKNMVPQIAVGFRTNVF